MGKTTYVTLECEALGERQFEISQAETLLNMKPNGGWKLNDKQFEFKDGIICRRNKGKAEE